MPILSLISTYINQILPIFQIILGTFGNIMNILIFTRRALRNHPCSIYFFALSINNIFILYVALLTRLFASGWHINPSASNNIVCKLRIFLAYVSLCLTQWLIVLASIDRFLSSCHTVRYRQLSNKSLARKATIILVLFIALIHFHIPIWWTTGYVGSISVCDIFGRVYDIFFSTFYIIFTCLSPPFLMIIFGLKMILNVRKIRTQVIPQNNNIRNVRLRSKDRQMITMLLFQVLITIICNTPFTVTVVYSTIHGNIRVRPLDPSTTAIYNFSADICRLLNYFNPVIGFYIYTLTSRTFRTEMQRMIKNRLRR